jgi:hypothetical protein
MEPSETGLSVAATDDCRRLGHEMEWRAVAGGTGDRVEICTVCDRGWRLALVQLGDPKRADEFVQFLRRETMYDRSTTE